MRYGSGIAVLLVLMSQPPGVAQPPAELEKAEAARRILDAWHSEQPEPGTRFLHMVCWTPSDRDFPADYKARLTRIMGHIREFYLREMERFGFEGRTIGLKYDDRNQLVLHTVIGHHASEHYEVSSGSEIRRECLPALKMAGIDPDRETIMILCNLATWDEKQLRFTHKSPYYAGGSFRSGTAWQLDSPELDSRNLNLTKPIIRDGQYGRISLGKHNSIFIGGIAHELGHALGLPHCKARPDEAVRGTALMGSGNRTYGDELRGEGRGSFLTLAHALRLASHPQFSGSLKGLRAQTSVSVEELSVRSSGTAIQVSGVVKGSPPIYAVVAYFDPEGGSDYDAATVAAVPSADGHFSLSCDALPAGKPGELRLFPLHTNGSAAGQMSRTRFRYSYDIGDDGTPDLSAIQTRQLLEPIVTALVDGDREKAIELADRIKLAKAAAIAAQLVNPVRPAQTPADYRDDAVTIALTRFKPESVKVGWARPTFNRIPENSMLLETGGQIFETGIYAHAPARHTYQLGGQWKSLAGKVGLADGHRGSVRFEIRADGSTVWKSNVIRTGEVVKFAVKLKGITQLDLLTDPTDDGPGADWGLWLEPTLTR